MLLKDVPLASFVVDRLRQFNIQTVEQLFAASLSERRTLGLSSALEMTNHEFSRMICDLREKYPQLSVQEKPKKRYYMGYRLNDSTSRIVEDALSAEKYSP